MTDQKESPGQNKFVKAFSDLVGLFDTKARASATVAMILIILYLWNRTDQLQTAAVLREKEFTAQIIAEVRKQVKQPLEDMKETNRQALDSNRSIIDSTRREIKPILETIKETVKKINTKR